MGPVVVPTRTERLWFWVLLRRPAGPHGPWVVLQVLDPRFSRRRGLAAGAFLFVVQGLPQLLIGLEDGRAFHFWAVGLMCTALLVALVLPRRVRPGQQDRLLLHLGLDREGRDVPRRSAWRSATHEERTVTLLVAANTLVLGSALAVAFDHHAKVQRCHGVPAGTLRGIERVLAPPTVRVDRARLVDGPLQGLHYVAFFVTTTNGSRRGPVVFRVIDPGSRLSLSASDVSIDAEDALARQLAPTVGFEVSRPSAPEIAQVRFCSEQG